MKKHMRVVYLSVLICAVVGGPVADPIEVEDVEAGSRADTISFVAELKDSKFFPLLLDPFQVNKLTCGSVITFYDNSAGADVTVALDLCLTGLLLAKLLVIVPLILSSLDVGNLEGGLLGIFDKLGESLARLDLAASGPEGEPFERTLENAANKYSEESPEIKEGDAFGIFDKFGEILASLNLAASEPEGEPIETNLENAANKNSEESPAINEGGVFGIFEKFGEIFAGLDLEGSGPEGEPFETTLENTTNKYSQESLQLTESVATYDDQGYTGFGFGGWESGLQSFPDFSQVNQFSTNDLPRSFPMEGLEKLLTASLHGLDKAISIETKH